MWAKTCITREIPASSPCDFVENRVDCGKCIKKVLRKIEVNFVINPQKPKKRVSADAESYVYRAEGGPRNLPLYARPLMWYDKRTLKIQMRSHKT